MRCKSFDLDSIPQRSLADSAVDIFESTLSNSKSAQRILRWLLITIQIFLMLLSDQTLPCYQKSREHLLARKKLNNNTKCDWRRKSKQCNPLQVYCLLDLKSVVHIFHYKEKVKVIYRFPSFFWVFLPQFTWKELTRCLARQTLDEETLSEEQRNATSKNWYFL